jgi:hypothetical protein
MSVGQSGAKVQSLPRRILGPLFGSDAHREPHSTMVKTSRYPDSTKGAICW